MNRPLLAAAAAAAAAAVGFQPTVAGRAEGSARRTGGRHPVPRAAWEAPQEFRRRQIPIDFGLAVAAVAGVAVHVEGHLVVDESADRQGRFVVEVDCIPEGCSFQQVGPAALEAFDRLVDSAAMAVGDNAAVGRITRSVLLVLLVSWLLALRGSVPTRQRVLRRLLVTRRSLEHRADSTFCLIPQA
jgi:hypothetical protein